MAKSEKIRSTGKCATDLPVGGRKMARQRGEMARGPARRARRVNYPPVARYASVRGR
jgi:hypothetical protein